MMNSRRFKHSRVTPSILKICAVALLMAPGPLFATEEQKDEPAEPGAESLRDALTTAMSEQASLPSVIGDFNAALRAIGFQLSSLILAPGAAGDAGVRARSLPPESIEINMCAHVNAPRPGQGTSGSSTEVDDIWTCIIYGK